MIYKKVKELPSEFRKFKVYKTLVLDYKKRKDNLLFKW